MRKALSPSANEKAPLLNYQKVAATANNPIQPPLLNRFREPMPAATIQLQRCSASSDGATIAATAAASEMHTKMGSGYSHGYVWKEAIRCPMSSAN